MKKCYYKYIMLTSFLILFNQYVYCWSPISAIGSIFSSNKKHVEKVNHKEVKTTNSAKVTGIDKINIKKLYDTLADINVKITGIDKSFNQTYKDVHDIISKVSNINDKDIFKWGITAFGIYIIFSFLLFGFMIYINGRNSGKLKTKINSIEEHKNNVQSRKDHYKKQYELQKEQIAELETRFELMIDKFKNNIKKKKIKRR